VSTKPTTDDAPLLDEDDPLLEEVVAASMADYIDLLPPEVAEEIRSSLRGLFTFHPEAQRLLRQARAEAAVVDRSVTVARQRPGDAHQDQVARSALSLGGCPPPRRLRRRPM
jgi:hypothetical protein